MKLSDIDLLDRDIFTKGVPHEWFTYLRKHAPVYKHPEPDGGPGFWVFSKHEDVINVGRNAKVFSSAAERGGVVGLDEAALLAAAQAEAERLWNTVPEWHWQGLTADQLSPQSFPPLTTDLGR